MINPFEMHKVREIVFAHTQDKQLQRAFDLLSGLANLRVESSPKLNTLVVRYSIEHYTLEGLERALEAEGFQLDHSMLHGIARKVIYYCEDTTCHNMDIPVHPTKKNEKNVFVKAYDQHLHGDHDEHPPERRSYK